MPLRSEAKVNFTPPKRTSRLRISTLCLFSACIKKTIAVLVCKVTNFFGHTQKKIAKFLRNGVFFCRLSRAFGPRIAMVDTLFYGRSDAPHCSFRSNCQFKAILHAKSTGRHVPPLSPPQTAYGFGLHWGPRIKVVQPTLLCESVKV